MAGRILTNISNIHDQDSGLLLGYINPVTGREEISSTANRAYKAWRAQPKTYKLATVPDPTIFIDSIRGLDTNAGTKVAPYQTLGKLLTALPTAGACIALANDSLFDLAGTGVSFSVAAATAINGTNETTRITFTNYDPGNVPSQRPRIRNRYLPTSGQWTWDATVQAWYYTNPNARFFGAYDALVRFSNGKWGNSRSTNLPSLVAGLLSLDYDYYADDTNKRMYMYAPQATDPTTYYGGVGSVILGEAERGSLQLSRCGSFVTIDNIIFEDCGAGIVYGNFSGAANLDSFVVQNCQFLNCGRGIAAIGDDASSFSQSARFLQNNFRGMAGAGIRSNAKFINTDVAGNYFSAVNQSTSHGGAVYFQGTSAGLQTLTGNRLFENYCEDALFNRGNCPFDGAAYYFESRVRGWDAFKNFATRCHVGIINNSGRTLTVRHNIFDDVDIPYVIADGNSVGAVNSTFEHNTAINCGFNKYRVGDSALSPLRPESDPQRAYNFIYTNVGTSAVMNHRNNIIQAAPGAPAVAGMEVRLSGTYDASGNHFVGAFSNFVQTYQFGAAATVVPAANTSAAAALQVDDNYSPLSSVPLAPVLSTLPSPLDAYGVASATPKKGAVSL